MDNLRIILNSGNNPVKPCRRAMDDLRMRIENDANTYKVRSSRKEWLSENNKHVSRAGACINSFRAAKKENNDAKFSEHQPENLKTYSEAMQYGYYMHPEITSYVTNCYVAGFDGLTQADIDDREKLATLAMDNFRCLLRGEPYNLRIAVRGADMILYSAKQSDNILPKGLLDLANNLRSAPRRIRVGRTYSNSSPGVVLGTVHTTGRHDVGDVRVKKTSAQTMSFFTKAISTKRTRYGFLGKRPRGHVATRIKLGAAYQSLYRTIGESNINRDKGCDILEATDAEGGNNFPAHSPDIINVVPLFGSENDGPIFGHDGESDEDLAADVLLKETLRYLVTHSGGQVYIAAEGDNYKDLRKSCHRKLKQSFRPMQKKVVKKPVATRRKDTSEAGSDTGIHASRSVADRASNSIATLPSKKNRPITKIAVTPGKGSTKSERDSEALPSFGDAEANGGAESGANEKMTRGKSAVDMRDDVSEASRDIGDSKSSSHADGSMDSGKEAGSESERSDDRTEEARHTMESSGVVTPEKQERKSASLDIGASYSGADSDSSSCSGEDKANSTVGLQATLGDGNEEPEAEVSNRSSMLRRDGLMPETMDIDEVVLIERKKPVKKTEGFNTKASKSAPRSRAMEANTAGSGGDGFKDKRAKDVKSEGVRLAKGNIRRSLGTAPRVVFDTYAFSKNGNRPLKLQEIRNQLKVAVDPLRTSYLMDSGLEVIPAYQLDGHISGLGLQIKSILFEISKAKSTLGYGNEGKLETMADSLQKCGAILKQTQRMLDSATSEDRRNQVKKALQRVVKVMDIVSRSPTAKAVEKERVRQRPEKNVVSRSTGKEVGSDRSRAEMIEAEASGAAFSLQNYWRTSQSIEKGRFEQGLVDILNISAGAKDKAGLTELEKNHARLLSVYLAIEKIKDGKDQDGLVQLYKEAMRVVENMLRSSPMHQ
jgi:hypothetical protein